MAGSSVNPSVQRTRNALKIVAIGGGTGLSTLLHGLKPHVFESANGSPYTRRLRLEITAIVTVTDDGGSSGRLRRQLDVLPPGDIRNCMVALSEDEALMSRLFQYRFSSGHGLRGHSFGNLFLTALTHLTGDFPLAIKLSSDILASVGRIYPSTAENVILRATLEDGATVLGETQISRSTSRIERISLEPRRCKPLKEALRAIEEADLITLGPGSLFTSVVPNLLVQGIPSAIQHSPAIKAHIANLMWQPGETMGFTVADHVDVIHRHARRKILDCVVVNTHPIAEQQRRRYARARVKSVEVKPDRLNAMGVSVIGRDLLAPVSGKAAIVRHDPAATAAVAIELAAAGRRRRNRLAPQQKHLVG